MALYKHFFVLIVCLFCDVVAAQLITGTVSSSEADAPLFGSVNVRAAGHDGSITEFTRLRNGQFSLQLQQSYEVVYLEIVASDHEAYQFEIFEPKAQDSYSYDIVLTKSDLVLLEDLVVEGARRAFEVKEDTISFRVEAYRDGSETKVIDVIKKLPGMSVDDATGAIKYNGKSIETLMLGGDNLFGRNYAVGSKNINVEIVESIEVIENFQENPIFRETQRSENVALNLTLKKNIADWSGNIGLGAGMLGEHALAAMANASLLTITHNVKNMAFANYNNVGANSSPINYLGGEKSLESKANELYVAPRLMQEMFVGNQSLDERANINSQLFASNNLLYRLNSRSTLRSNTMYINDVISSDQFSRSTYNFEGESFSTTDASSFHNRPAIFQQDFKWILHKNERNYIENETRFMHENIFAQAQIIRNNIDSLHTHTRTENTWLRNQFAWTHRYNASTVIHSFLTNSYYASPQSFSVTNPYELQDENYTQNSTFRHALHHFNTTIMKRMSGRGSPLH
ncbi:MAG: hypothetical protein Q4F57_10290 [Weeksellaceae bacterium]|nr:hypothetical protein [Weeksellaceae bacterium]